MQAQCDGWCEKHEGDVRRVTVASAFGPMDFWYCDVAVAQDRSVGLTVTEHVASRADEAHTPTEE